MRVTRYTWRILLLLVLLPLGCIAALLLYLSLTDYKPKPIEELKVMGRTQRKAEPEREINLLSWNIGYAGLGKEMDFFYDGGKTVRPEVKQYQQYLNGIFNLLSHSDTIDLLLLQEVDQDAKRSYFVDQVDLLTNALQESVYSFASNYDVKFIPFPILKPLSKVKAGLLTLSRFRPSESLRYGSPVNFFWPKRIFFLDRCFLLMRFPLQNGKDLVVINLHQSAWEEGAKLRKHETKLLEEIVLKEYSRGNYVIAGGDWNQNPPGHQIFSFFTGDKAKENAKDIIKKALPEGWKYVFDPKLPTNRSVAKPYRKGVSETSLIDYYLVSPNIEVREVRTLTNGFAFSDHHPVYLRVKLLSEAVIASQPPLH